MSPLQAQKDGKNSFTACNHVFESGPTIYITRDGIRMTKVGIVKARFSRRPQAWWKLKRITVEKTRTGKYFCSILYECGEQLPEPVQPTPETTVGLKYSMAHFYVADHGGRGDPPRWLQESREKLANLQRRISRMQPGSKRYQAAVQKYRALHEHIANQRRDFIHKESRRIANAWDAVCIRADALAELSQKLHCGSGPDSGYSMFRACLGYKLARQGKPLIVVDRYTPTTRACSACGFVRDSVSHQEKSWTCPKCGTVHKREVNAAKNIKAEGLAQYFDRQEQNKSA